MVKRMVNLLKSPLIGSIEKCVVRAIFSSLNCRELYDVMRKNSDIFDLLDAEEEKTGISIGRDTNGAGASGNTTGTAGFPMNEGSRTTDGSSIGDIHLRAATIYFGDIGTRLKCLSGGFKRVKKESRND